MEGAFYLNFVRRRRSLLFPFGRGGGRGGRPFQKRRRRRRCLFVVTDPSFLSRSKRDWHVSFPPLEIPPNSKEKTSYILPFWLLQTGLSSPQGKEAINILTNSIYLLIWKSFFVVNTTVYTQAFILGHNIWKWDRIYAYTTASRTPKV